MRFVWLVCFAVIFVAVVIWLRPGVMGAADTSRSRSASAQKAQAQEAALASHETAAGSSIRAARSAHSGANSNAAPAVTTGVATATATAQSRRAEPQAASEPAQAQPKPAGELFVPLIAEDPTRVFAPATVNYHAAVQGEESDPTWGPYAESALRDYITEQFGDRFEIPYVDCRQDLCELQVAGRIGGDVTADTHDIQQAMSRMKQQAWWTEWQFDQEHGTVGSSQDGRMILLWFFSRK